MTSRLAPLLLTAVLALAGCFPVQDPVRTSFFDGRDDRTAIVLLPGFGASDRTFDKLGLVGALREAGVEADLVAVNAHYGYYFRDLLEPTLREDVLPGLRGRYDRVFVLGISMGGLGALLTARDFPDTVDGVILLSPYTGRRATLRSVQAAPRLGAWQAPPEPAWDEALWVWLQALDGAPGALPPIHLGYGDADLGPENLAFLARHLPPERVRVVAGGHTWATWRTLVRDLVPAALASASAAP